MEIKSKLPNDKIGVPRMSSKPSLSKLLTQRKCQNTMPLLKKLPENEDKLSILGLEKQNPINYLESIQSNHQQIQKSFEQSLLTTAKWRSYNSPIQTPKDRSKQKENILFDTLYGKRKQLSAIKVYNHVNNETELSTKKFDEPEYIEFLQEAVSKSTRKAQNISSNGSPRNTVNSSKKLSRVKKGFEIKQNYTVGQQRKELQTLQHWIKSKVESYESHQSSGQIMFTDRINFMNMAFYEISRIVGTFSTETKSLIEYLHKKYYEYYSFLTECTMEQNKKLKAQMTELEDRMLKTINYYEEKLIKIKQESDEKGEKIVFNFQKCIELKKRLEKENKVIKHNLLTQQKKTKFVEEALIKVTTLFLALGHKNIHEMIFSLQSFSPNDSFITNTMLGKSKKLIQTEAEMEIQKRKILFQEWCGYLIKMIHRILVKQMAQKEGNDVRKAIFKKQAFDVIKQYMTENDDSISPADAQNILNKFLSTEEEEHKIRKGIKNVSQADEREKNLMELQELNRKFENMYTEVSYQLPTFEDVYNKMNVIDVECQANIPRETENSAVQTLIEKTETGIMVLPKVKSRQVDASSELRQRNQIESGVSYFCDVFEMKKQNKAKTNKKSKENEKRSKTNQRDNSIKLRRTSNESLNLSQHSLKISQTRRQLYSQNRDLNQFDESTFKNLGSKRFHEVGVNTNITKMNKIKTVDFIFPESFEDEEGAYNRDTLISESPSYDNKTLSQNTQDERQQADFMDLQSQKNCSQKKFRQVKRKNGFLISAHAKKIILSQKYIRSQSSIGSSSECSIEQDQKVANLQTKFSQEGKGSESLIKSRRQNALISKQKSQHSQKSLQNGRTSLSKDQKNIRRPIPKKPKDYKTFEQRVGRKRSYFKLSKVEYASKQDADTHKIKEHLIRVPKKKLLRQKALIDPLDLHLELTFKNSQKIKFLTSVTLWAPKLMFEMKKIRHRVQNIRPSAEMRNESMGVLKNYMVNIVTPLLKDFLKSYCQLMKNDKFDFGQSSMLNSSKGAKGLNLKKQLIDRNSTGSDKNKNVPFQLSYNQKLSPLLYNVINFTQYHQNRTSSENQLFFSALKWLRFKSSKMEAYNSLIEGTCVELDIFVKTIYQFNVAINANNMDNPDISYFSLQNGLAEALEGYFTNVEVEKIFLEVKKFMLSGHESGPYRRASLKNELKRGGSNKNLLSRKPDQNSKIGYFDLLMIIFRHIKQRQQIQQKKYSIIKEVISKNSESTSYQEIMYFLQCLPIPNDKRKKILDNCFKYVVYWDSPQATVPNDILYFILDKYELYNSSNGSNQNANLIKEYIITRSELYFKTTLLKVIKNPEGVINSTYIFSYKIPKIFHRILHQIRTSKSFRQKKLLSCVLTLIFCRLVDTEMEKRYMPSLFNGLLAIPLS